MIELLPLLEKDKGIEIVDVNRLGSQYSFRFNVLHKPFNDARIRQAALYALNQKDFLLAGIGNPKYFKECKAVFICGTPNATDKGFEDKLESNFTKSKELLKEAGYDGTPVVLLFATDTNTGRLTPIVKALLERGGFAVDIQPMDWQTVLSRRRPQGAAVRRRLARFHDVLGLGRPARPHHVVLRGRRVRQGRDRLAVRRQARRVAQRLCPHDRRSPAQGPGRAGAGAAVGVSDLRSARAVQHPAGAPTTVTGNLEAPAPVFWNVKKQ